MAGLGVSVDPKILGVGVAGGALLFALIELPRGRARAS
jgi:hypothetical protein